MTSHFRLHNSVEIPILDLGTAAMGTWQEDSVIVVQSVAVAVQAGYRHVDTARAYGNERSVGQVLKESSLPRQAFFVTTKVKNADQGYDRSLHAFDQSRAALGLNYVDLYLIHWPAPAKQLYQESWQALERLYEEKQVRAIGVSNFEKKHLIDLCCKATTQPMMNQIQCHPYFSQRDLRHFCLEENIGVTAWSPF